MDRASEVERTGTALIAALDAQYVVRWDQYRAPGELGVACGRVREARKAWEAALALPAAPAAEPPDAARWMAVAFDLARSETVETCICADERDAAREAAQMRAAGFAAGAVALLAAQRQEDDPR